MLAVVGTTPVNEPPVVAPRDFDSDFLVPEGATLFYDIVQATFPDEIPNVTLPDFADNTFYVKVDHVEKDHDFGSGVIGTVIWYSMGIIFEQDETITIGEGVNAINIVIPSGAATPAPMVKGTPFFMNTPNSSSSIKAATPTPMVKGIYRSNGSSYGPSFFFLNDDWTDHHDKLTALGFSIDIDDATTFKASYTDSYGEAVGQWRKSDGVLEYLFFDNFSFIDMPGLTFELSLNHIENRPAPVAVGDDLTIYLDTFDVQVTGSGDISSFIEMHNITDTLSKYKDYEGVPLAKFVVTGVKGDFILCDSYFYNFDTEQLEKTHGGVVFNAFTAAITSSGDPFTYKYYEDGGSGDPNWELVNGGSPWVTPDWNIYKGIMILGNTLLGTYFNEVWSAIEIPTDVATINSATISAGFITKRNFHYFKVTAAADFEINLTTPTKVLDTFSIEAAYVDEVRITFNMQSYVAYHDSGPFAAFRLKADFTADWINVTGHDQGDLTVNIDIKLRNHDYNPPDVIGGGFIPGFTWLIAIPTLLGVAALGLIRRKK